MTRPIPSELEALFNAHALDPVMHSILQALKSGRVDYAGQSKNELIAAYQRLIPKLEETLWRKNPSAQLLSSLQLAYREMEALLALSDVNRRHSFVVVIPVADRPRHLECCLDSLLQLCRSFHYGGYANGRFSKVSALIADDSREPENIHRHRELSELFSGCGLETHYLGLEDQLNLLDALPAEMRRQLQGSLGNLSRENFAHKGPSLMRNITYLKLLEMTASTDAPLLFHFIDSDQEFRIRTATAEGEQDLYALNYFHHLDRIFNQTETEILTGKVVGDPPVSPAVMAGNFLQDLINFLGFLIDNSPKDTCAFHGATTSKGEDGAIYHDMAKLFGFTPSQTAYQYQCPLEELHDNGRCLEHFATRLGGFFHGEHPTRKTHYHHSDPLDSLTPARTIYTGNYVLRPSALRYFVPFAGLRLRMAGPVLGRIIQTEIGGRFISANLPMLHKRTLEDTGSSEFRPGILSTDRLTDLSDELVRQFYGDVMLFSITRLTAQGFPDAELSDKSIQQALKATDEELLGIYNERHEVILENLSHLTETVNDPAAWWNQAEDHAPVRQCFHSFLQNVAHNFGPEATGYRLINSPEEKALRHADLAAAIGRYREDRRAWESIILSGLS